MDAVGLARVLVICGPTHEDLGRRVADLLGDRAVAVLPEARMHVPAEVARRAVELAMATSADGCVAVGGGSAIGLGKAVALQLGLPVVAVPTTYAGSEMTPVWGLTEDGAKRTGRDPRVQPVAVVYDPELTLAMPLDLTATSGLNAVAHAVEGLYAPDGSPVTALMAEEAVRAFAGALPVLAADGADLDARGEALYAAWLCGSVLGATTMGLHHKLCHVLGGTLGLPHAATHAVLLPHVLAFNAARGARRGRRAGACPWHRRPGPRALGPGRRPRRTPVSAGPRHGRGRRPAGRGPGRREPLRQPAPGRAGGPRCPAARRVGRPHARQRVPSSGTVRSIR